MRPFARMHWQMKDTSSTTDCPRARKVVENAFGILANHWRLYHSHIYLNPDNVTKVVKATAVFHNILTLPNDKSILMLWIIGPKYLMMPLKTWQSKEINLQQLPMMSETTLLTTSTVIVVLLNGKMIVHKIEFKIRVITYRPWRYSLGTVALSLNLLVRHWLADQKCQTKNVFFLFKKAVRHMTSVNCLTGWVPMLPVQI